MVRRLVCGKIVILYHTKTWLIIAILQTVLHILTHYIPNWFFTILFARTASRLSSKAAWKMIQAIKPFAVQSGKREVIFAQKVLLIVWCNA